MDPYIERPAIWGDFHDHLIVSIRSALQPHLRPRYAALGQGRSYVVESERPTRPDFVVEPDGPAGFDPWREEIRQPLIHIIEPAAGNRIVTVIEVLSPDNKEKGDGRDSYLKTREELWERGTNVVEIDLLRDGDPAVRISADRLAHMGPRHYLVAVTRHCTSHLELYLIPLDRRLPQIAIPLAADDRDVTLDLQAAFTRCWSEGPYPELLRYDENPPGTMAPEDITWCHDLLREGGFRNGTAKEI
jgi:hypothetical protein